MFTLSKSIIFQSCKRILSVGYSKSVFYWKMRVFARMRKKCEKMREKMRKIFFAKIHLLGYLHFKFHIKRPFHHGERCVWKWSIFLAKNPSKKNSFNIFVIIQHKSHLLPAAVLPKCNTFKKKPKLWKNNKNAKRDTFAKSSLLAKSNSFTKSNPCAKSNSFAKSNPFAKSNMFAKSNPFAKSNSFFEKQPLCEK